MPKSRPALFDFLDKLTAQLRAIGKDDLAITIRARYAKGTEPDLDGIVQCLVGELDTSDQLQFYFITEDHPFL